MVEDYKTKNKTHVDAGIRVRKWQQPQLQLHLVTKFHGRHYLLQSILGKWCCVRCSDLCKLFVNGKFTKRFHFLCARIDLLFIIFICWLYSTWATIRLLHHFGFLCVLVLGYPVRIFRAIDAKYIMFRVSWCKSLKGSATPDEKCMYVMEMILTQWKQLQASAGQGGLEGGGAPPPSAWVM